MMEIVFGLGVGFYLLSGFELIYLGVISLFILWVGMLYKMDLFGLVSLKGWLYGGLLGVDMNSYFMIYLSVWIVGVVVLMVLSFDFMKCIMFTYLFLSLLMAFYSLSIVVFFIFFEMGMLPVFLFITYWGLNKERYVAAMYMLIYTVVSSLPSLVFLFIGLGGISFNMDIYFYYDLDWDSLCSMVVMLAFMVKIPIFMVHIWLPKAHVEAPVFGSMILASIMLKLGGYGVLRLLGMFMFSEGFFYSMIILSFCGGLIISILCLSCLDLKMVVAYSSIVHMGMMLGGMFSGVVEGLLGGLIMMVSHGICSSGLFYMVDLFYCRVGSRLMMFMGGILSVFPVLGYWWFLILFNNMGSPPSLNMISEILCLMGLAGESLVFMGILLLIIFFCSCFIVFMCISITGEYFGGVSDFVGVGEFFILFIHLLPLNGVVLVVGDYF